MPLNKGAKLNRELIFIDCGLFVIILVGFFVLFLLSLRFGQISPLAFFRWFTATCIVTTMNNYTYTHTCRNIFNTLKTSQHSSLEKYTSHNWNHFEIKLLNLRINFYLLRTFCPHLGSFCVVSSFTTFRPNFTSGFLQVIYRNLG